MRARIILSSLFAFCVLNQALADETRQVAASPSPATQPVAGLPPRGIPVKTYEVQYTPMNQVLEAIQERMQGRPDVDLSVNGKTIRFRGTAKDHAEVAELIAKADRVQTRTKVYPVKNAKAEEIARVIDETFGEAVRCVADRGTNCLILTIPEDMVNRVEELLAQLEAAPKEEQQVTKLYDLKHVKPEELADTLRDALPGDLRIAALEFTNSLLVTGKASAFAGLESLLKSLDVPNARTALQTITIRLKHADADRVEDVIRSVFDETATADPATRTVIVRAPEAAIQQIMSLVEQLDVPDQTGSENGAPREIRIYALKHIAPDDNLTRTLDLAVDHEDAAFYVDPKRRTVIVRGNTATLRTVGNLLGELDVAQESPAPKPQPALAAMRVRLVLLIGNPEEEMDLATVPTDLKPVVEELERIGVTDLRLAAQSVVEITGGSFTVVASPVVAGAHELRFEGKLIDTSADRPRVELNVQASRLPEPPEEGQPRRRPVSARQICNISTTVAAPPGHAVVLGMAPIERSNWVFVLQLMPAP